MGVRQRARMESGRDEAGKMRHVDHEIGADGIGDRAEPLEIDDARIGGTAGDDEGRLVLLGEPLDLVIVDEVRIPRHAILHRVEPLARQVGRRAVGQMTAGGEAHADDGVARLDERQHDRLVRLRAGMGLHIGEAAVEQPLGAVDRQLLDNIDVLAAAIIAAPGIAFRVFVGEERAGRVKHRPGHDILRGDQLDFVLLPLMLVLDGGPNFGVRVLKMPGEKGALARLGAPNITCRHG